MGAPCPWPWTADFLRVRRFLVFNSSSIQLILSKLFACDHESWCVCIVYYILSGERVQMQLVNGRIYEGCSSTDAELLEIGMISHNILVPFIVGFSSTSTFRSLSSGALRLSYAQDIVSIIFRGIQEAKSVILCRCKGFSECAVRTRSSDIQASLG